MNVDVRDPQHDGAPQSKTGPAASTWFLGRLRAAGRPTEHVVRIETSGASPTHADAFEEIDDPLPAALSRNGGDPSATLFDLVRAASPLPGGLRGTIEDFELAPPVRPSKILGVGRNFRAHAKELGNEVPTTPLLFAKAPSALLASGQPIPLPRGYARIDMEAELVVVIGRVMHRVGRDRALSYVAGYTLGNDISCRDLQKSDGQWTRAKGFDGFSPAGPFVRLCPPGFALPPSARVQGRIDGDLRQDAPLSDLVFDIPTILSTISDCMTLEPGDLIYMGTPEGVCPLTPGLRTEVELAGFDLGRLSNPVQARPEAEP